MSAINKAARRYLLAGGKANEMLGQDGLVFLPLLAGIARPLVLGGCRQFPADFVFDDFEQRDIGGAETGDVRDQGAAGATTAELSWRTRRETRLIRTLGLPTFSSAFLQSSAFKVLFSI